MHALDLETGMWSQPAVAGNARGGHIRAAALGLELHNPMALHGCGDGRPTPAVTGELQPKNDRLVTVLVESESSAGAGAGAGAGADAGAGSKAGSGATAAVGKSVAGTGGGGGGISALLTALLGKSVSKAGGMGSDEATLDAHAEAAGWVPDMFRGSRQHVKRSAVLVESRRMWTIRQGRNTISLFTSSAA